MPEPDLKEEIRAWGLELGFTRIGFAAAEEPAGSRRLLEWLMSGFHGGMAWMARDPETRIDPQKILPGARSVVAAALNYFHPDPVPLRPGGPRISRYAWGDDYHQVMREKLRTLEGRIRAVRPGVRTRVACDTSPVMDKAWAAAAGIGWQGKNTCLISPREGSWLFLGEIFLDVRLTPDPPVEDHCGTCTACLEACPTGALTEPYLLDSRRCISYLTIEHRGPFDAEQARQVGDWLAGCDICQDVCPWNRKAPVSSENRFRPRATMADLSSEDWTSQDDAAHAERVRGTALTRIKAAEMRRNAAAVLRNHGADAGL